MSLLYLLLFQQNVKTGANQYNYVLKMAELLLLIDHFLFHTTKSIQNFNLN